MTVQELINILSELPKDKKVYTDNIKVNLHGEIVLTHEDIHEEEQKREEEINDERIKKAIIAYISNGQHFGVSNTDMIAWLKKQETKDNTISVLPSLGNNQVQDILEDMGMLDDNGRCSHTAEEIFKAGIEYAYNINNKSVSSITFNAKLLPEVLGKHLYTCFNKTNNYVRSEEDHITLIELINKIIADLNIK